MKNRQKHKTTDRDGIETQGGVQMDVYGCGWMGRSVVGRANTKAVNGGAQQASHAHEHSYACVTTSTWWHDERKQEIKSDFRRHGP